MDSEHTIDSGIGVTGEEETVLVEKPEEDVSESSDSIEAEEAMFAAVHNYLTCELAERYPQDLQQGAEVKWLCFTSTNWVYTIHPAPAVFTVQIIEYYSILIVYYCYNRQYFILLSWLFQF